MSAPSGGPGFLSDAALRLLLFGGKGGTGKTSCAVAAALSLARELPGRTLLLSTDPAHSLADCLADTVLPESLEVVELDAAACLRRFRAHNEHRLREIASRGTFLEDGEIDRFLGLSLPGLDELMAFLEVADRLRDEGVARIVLDTAPTGHTLRLLEMPGLVRRWLRALDALLAKHRHMRAVFGAPPAHDDLDAFIDGLEQSVTTTEALLQDPRACRFVPVVLAESLSIFESTRLIADLGRLRLTIAEVVVNRLRPARDCATCDSEREAQLRAVLPFKRGLEPIGAQLWGVPLYAEEVRGSALLLGFWSGARRVAETEPPPRRAPGPQAAICVENPVPPAAAAAAALTVFAGKGGVGKTTLACAAAASLARSGVPGGALLLSSDPAHSLAACLGVPVGASPTPVGPGLVAAEMDAEATLAAYKRDYAEDLSRLLGQRPQLDLTFDREVLERIFDLAPPGLDEIVAVTQVMDALAREHVQRIVLDTAPTGHLIRVLEMPELADRWVKTLFEVLLRYSRIIRLPKTMTALLGLSKRLRSLRARLSNPESTRLFAVAIPTEMALAETLDLVAACRRLAVPVAGVIVNLAAPAATGCPLCAALAGRERLVLERFRAAFAGLRVTVVPRQEGLAEGRGLEELGAAVFRSPAPAHRHTALR